MLIQQKAMMLFKIRSMQLRQENGKSSRSTSSKRNLSQSPNVYLLPLYILILGAGLGGCGNSGPLGIGGFNFGTIGVNPSKINEILQNRTFDATVYLQGQVTNRAPILGAGAYKLKDATGTIWVFTAQTIPNVGDEVLIKGRVLFQSIPVNGQEVGEVYVREEQLLNRKPGKSGQPVQTQASP